MRFMIIVKATREAWIEVRELHEPEDFIPGKAVERFRKIGIGKGK